MSDRTGQVEPQVLEHVTRNTFNRSNTYINGSPIARSGLDWVVDFRQIEPLHTSLRLDGSYYHYHGVEHTFIAAHAHWRTMDE